MSASVPVTHGKASLLVLLLDPFAIPCPRVEESLVSAWRVGEPVGVQHGRNQSEGVVLLFPLRGSEEEKKGNSMCSEDPLDRIWRA